MEKPQKNHALHGKIRRGRDRERRALLPFYLLLDHIMIPFEYHAKLFSGKFFSQLEIAVFISQ